jgi:hypothetical protein
MRDELTDEEWTAIKPMLPNKPRGVPRGLAVWSAVARTFQATSVHTPPATIASFADGGPE